MAGKHRSARSLAGFSSRSLRLPPLALILLLILVGAFVFRFLADSPSAPSIKRTREATGIQAGREEAPVSMPPTTRPTNTASPSQVEPRGRLVIHGTGDVNLDPTYIPNLRQHGYAYAWSGLAGLFRRDDLTVINLECPVARSGTPAGKEFTFRGDPAALPAMKRAGVEVANLGNNHSQDLGAQAMLETRKNLLAVGIEPVGAGRDAKQANAPALIRTEGWTIAVLGFGGVFPTPEWFAGPGHPGMADGDDIKNMVAAVRAADRIADLVVVSIHWGVELDTRPRAEDIARAHAMIDAGADAIFGHHPHRLQPMERYKGRPIFYSLGNFVWPSLSVAGSTTAVAEVIVTGEGRVLGRMIPAYIESSGHPVLRGR